jgi:hypothetical protein
MQRHEARLYGTQRRVTDRIPKRFHTGACSIRQLRRQRDDWTWFLAWQDVASPSWPGTKAAHGA